MAVTHVVLFEFKPEVTPEKRLEGSAKLLALKEQCIKTTSNSTYIRSIKAGKDMSTEGMQNGVTHVFVVEFNSVEDRDYYVQKDDAHHAYIKYISEFVTKAIVVDFQDGKL